MIWNFLTHLIAGSTFWPRFYTSFVLKRMENWNDHCQKNDNCKLMLIDSTNSKARVPNGLRNLVNPPNFAGKLRRYLCDNVDLYYLGANYFDSCLAEFQDLHDKVGIMGLLKCQFFNVTYLKTTVYFLHLSIHYK